MERRLGQALFEPQEMPGELAEFGTRYNAVDRQGGSPPRTTIAISPPILSLKLLDI